MPDLVSEIISNFPQLHLVELLKIRKVDRAGWGWWVLGQCGPCVELYVAESTMILIAALNHTLITAVSQRRCSHAIDRTFTQRKEMVDKQMQTCYMPSVL